MNLSYSELMSFDNFIDRYRYLKLSGIIGEETFGYDRYLNQAFYKSQEWRHFRNQMILRDIGCDLAHPDFMIGGSIYIHHLNPIRKKDVIYHADSLMDPENVVCVSFDTHNAIHYGDESLLLVEPVIRRPNDTCPWR